MMASEEFKNKLVVALRTDIKISPGKMAVQVAHAAVNCAFSCKKNNERWFKEWYREGQKKVVLKGGSLKDLYELKSIADSIGLETSLIQDAGMTEVDPGTVTCLGIGPGPSPEVNKVTGSLPLL